MLLSVTTKNMALCPKLCPKFLLGLIRRLYSLGSIKYTPLPPLFKGIFKTFIHYAGLMLDALTVALFSKSYQYNSTLVLRQLVAILSVLCAVMNVLWSVLL